MPPPLLELDDDELLDELDEDELLFELDEDELLVVSSPPAPDPPVFVLPPALHAATLKIDPMTRTPRRIRCFIEKFYFRWRRK